jgi:hypothetical protein
VGLKESKCLRKDIPWIFGCVFCVNDDETLEHFNCSHLCSGSSCTGQITLKFASLACGNERLHSSRIGGFGWRGVEMDDAQNNGNGLDSNMIGSTFCDSPLPIRLKRLNFALTRESDEVHEQPW